MPCNQCGDNPCRCVATPQDNDTFHYYRDHEASGAWGVRSAAGRVVGYGMDKGEALMIALFMSGRHEHAEQVRRAWAAYFKDYPEHQATGGKTRYK